jgi:hypothetical protein
MPSSNHLEQLVAEWYEFRGYFVRRNVRVGRRPGGGHECELDVVAFHPETRHLVQIEPSTDTDSIAKREERYTKKFAAGRRHIPSLFTGLNLPAEIEQIGLFLYGGMQESIGGGKMMLVSQLVPEIMAVLKNYRINSRAVPEGFPLLRTLQLVSEYRSRIIPIWNETA